MLTAPTAVKVTSSTPTSVTLAWSPAVDADHLDLWRSPTSRSGYFGPAVKVNASPIAGDAVGYVDGTAEAQKHYCFFVMAVAADGSMAPASPVFGTTWSGTDTARAIYEAVLARMGGVLTGWTEMRYIVTPENNDRSSRDKSFGLVLGPDEENLSGAVGAYEKVQKLTVLLADTVRSSTKDDQSLIDVMKDLSAKMEQVAVDLAKTKCGVPQLVVSVDPVHKAEPEYFEDKQLVFLRGNLSVRYRVRVN